jgi:hypothetical protein
MGDYGAWKAEQVEDLKQQVVALRERHTDQLEQYRALNDRLIADLAKAAAQITGLRKEIIDITARSIEGRMEAWDLIDQMIPYLKYCSLPPDENEPLIFPGSTKELLAEIEEKRKPHD